MSSLSAEHPVKGAPIARSNCGHQLEEEVVAEAASSRTRLTQPALELSPARGSDVVDNAVGLDLLLLVLGFDETVPAEAVDDLV